MSESVWIQLFFDDDGKYTKSGEDPIQLRLAVNSNIYDLKEAVYQAKDKSLGHCNAADLLVCMVVDGTRVKLDPGDTVSEYRTTSKEPLLVEAPAQVHVKESGKNFYQCIFPYGINIGIAQACTL